MSSNTLDNIRDCICPVALIVVSKIKYLIPNTVPIKKGTAPTQVKNFNGLYIIYALIIVTIDFCT